MGIVFIADWKHKKFGYGDIDLDNLIPCSLSDNAVSDEIEGFLEYGNGAGSVFAKHAIGVYDLWDERIISADTVKPTLDPLDVNASVSLVQGGSRIRFGDCLKQVALRKLYIVRVIIPQDTDRRVTLVGWLYKKQPKDICLCLCYYGILYTTLRFFVNP